MSQPRTLATADAIARQAVRDRMTAYGRTIPNAADRAAGAVLKANLLWHVGAQDGGFIGLSDSELIERCNSYGLAYSTVSDAMYAPGTWPESNAIEHPVLRQLEMVGGESRL